MLLHNLKLVYRNFRKYRGSFFINLVGLSTGLACTILIYLWVTDELNVDKFHDNIGDIYKVMENRQQADEIITKETTSGYMAEALSQEIPEVKYATVVRGVNEGQTLTYEDKNLEGIGWYVSKDFFNVFSYELLGENTGNWNGRNLIVLSKSLANQLFGSPEAAIGKSVKLEHQTEFFVSAVLEDVPANSSQQFDFLLSLEGFAIEKPWVLEWRSTPVQVFVLLEKGANPEVLNSKIKNYVTTKTDGKIDTRTPFFKAYSNVYLYGNYDNGKVSGGRIEYVKLFSIIAIFIIVIACINFMNLSTAKAARRIKEVGIRKAIGAARKTLIIQYLSESLILTFISLIVGVVLVLTFLPQFNELTGKSLVLEFKPGLVLSLLGIIIFTGLISGSYPALYLSGFKPAKVLKGALSSSTGEMWARKGLVVFQFVISVSLIVCVLVVYKQIDFIQSKNLGFDKDNIIMFEREGRAKQPEQLETFLTELRNIPGIKSASAIGHNLTGKNWGVYGFDWEGKDPNDNTEFENVVVYYDMMETLDIQMSEGRKFSEDFAGETDKIILNEAAIEHTGLKDPIGKTFTFWGRDKEIIGIAKNFHFESLHETIRPLMFSIWPDRTNRFMAKIESGRERETLATLEEFYTSYNPGFTFNYKFLDQQHQTQYVAEQRVAKLSRFFAALAIIISCLGLFGLATFTAERRLKEIGIRKILGSSQRSIIYLLSMGFTKMVLVAVAIALPVSYLFIRNWLNGFAYKITLDWWYFLAAGAMAIVITWLTIGFQLIKAASVSPVQTLRDD